MGDRELSGGRDETRVARRRIDLAELSVRFIPTFNNQRMLAVCTVILLCKGKVWNWSAIWSASCAPSAIAWPMTLSSSRMSSMFAIFAYRGSSDHGFTGFVGAGFCFGRKSAGRMASTVNPVAHQNV
jgi:hypothetical protein